ncbi:MAG: DUF4838 domain-containing protein, partial [Planctomycetota bacterium]
ALVRDGRPVATVVLAAEPAENARVAAAELRTYIEKMTGAKLPLATDEAPPPGPLVLVGASRLTAEIPGLKVPSGRTKDLREEGFAIRTHGNRLVLAGNDTDPYLGTRYAVVEFLGSLGVRWFLPGEFGEVVPRLATIEVGPLDVVERPSFPLRNFWEHARGNMAAECAEWKIHNKMNPRAQEAFGVPGDGSLVGYLPLGEFASHPDWFALERDGTRSQEHPCTTSEEMAERVAERVKAEARAGKQVSAFAPVDGNPRCWCERCARVGTGFDGFGANDRDPIPESSASNEWFYFVNRVLASVHREFPEHIVATNGYANRDFPPDFPPEVEFNRNRTLTVMFANISACTIHRYDDPKCWQMRRQAQMVRRWCELSDKLWIYNYNYTMLVGKGTLTPMVHRIRRNIPLLRDWGCIGFFDQEECDWSLTGLPTRIVRARLEWDADADVDAILEDFFSKWFGPAAKPLSEYYAALEAAFDEATVHGHEDAILPAIYTDELLERLGRSMRAAEAAVEAAVAAAAGRGEDVQPEPRGKFRSRLEIERLIYENLHAYAALEKAKAACDFPAAAARAGRMLEIQAELNRLTPFMGWRPYAVYDVEWEKKRMEALAAKTSGPEGELVAPLPEEAAFRTDPFDDGRYERWQDPAADTSSWKRIRAVTGWEAQGYQDAEGHPYRGVAWYQFDADVPPQVEGRRVFLCAPAVVSEAWVWVNGRYAGHRPYRMVWFRPHELELEVSKLLRPGARNRIAIRVLANIDVWGASGIYERPFLYAKKA